MYFLIIHIAINLLHFPPKANTPLSITEATLMNHTIKLNHHLIITLKIIHPNRHYLLKFSEYKNTIIEIFFVFHLITVLNIII